MDKDDLEIGKFFTTTGQDIWKLESFYDVPSCTLKNLETGEKQNFGMSGITAQSFKRIKMPEVKTG